MNEKAREIIAAALEDAERQREAALARREEALKVAEERVKHRDARKAAPAPVKERMNAVAEEVKSHRAETARLREHFTNAFADVRKALGIPRT